MQSIIRNRTEYAKSAKNGLTALETDPGGSAAREVRELVSELRGLLGHAEMEQARVVNG
jgi:cellulose biosynthesis protein BcsQ